MNARPKNPRALRATPPQWIRSLSDGFNTVTNNISLILLPVILDVWLWFGPHLRMKLLMENDISEIIRVMRQVSRLNMRPFWDSTEKTAAIFFEQYNLTSQLGTFPIGIPSLLGGQALLSGKAPVQTPLGLAPVVEIQSDWLFLLLWLVFTLSGLALGTFFFSAVARCCMRQIGNGECPGIESTLNPARLPALRPSVILWQTVQMIALMFILFIAILLVMVPAFWMSFYLFIVSPFLSFLVLLMASFSAIWFIIPLVFSPHGVFLCGQSLFNAMASSTRIVRFSLPGTSMFLLATIILYQGLDVLWLFPPDSSWLTGVGILGHAFITTGLLAASFMYYRRGLDYIQALRNFSLLGRTA